MKNLRFLVLVFALVMVFGFVLAACGGGSTTSPSTPAGDPAAGKAAFAALPCHTCHGDNAQGNVGPKLAGLGLTFDQFQTIVRNGKQQMPAWGTDKVTDQQLTDIYAWLKAGAQ